MSQLRCDNCDRLWSDFAAKVGERCGVRLNARHWCDGKLVEHDAPPQHAAEQTPPPYASHERRGKNG